MTASPLHIPIALADQAGSTSHALSALRMKAGDRAILPVTGHSTDYLRNNLAESFETFHFTKTLVRVCLQAVRDLFTAAMNCARVRGRVGGVHDQNWKHLQIPFAPFFIIRTRNPNLLCRFNRLHLNHANENGTENPECGPKKQRTRYQK